MFRPLNAGMMSASNIVHYERFRKVLDAFPNRLPKRVLSPYETKLAAGFPDPTYYLARRWAAKVLARSLLREHGLFNINIDQIQILNSDSGRPHIKFAHDVSLNPIEARLTESSMMISISDEPPYAVITIIVVLEGSSER